MFQSQLPASSRKISSSGVSQSCRENWLPLDWFLGKQGDVALQVVVFAVSEVCHRAFSVRNSASGPLPEHFGAQYVYVAPTDGIMHE